VGLAIYLIIGFSAVVHLFSRDYFLPFLGEAVYPCGSLTPKVPHDADLEVKIKVDPNVNVIYWAAEPNSKVVDNPWLAYSEYENTGVALSGEDGMATLKVRKPASYNVPKMGLFQKNLKPHIHYRTCNMTGMMSRVETVFLPEEAKKAD
jgi:hypothetical protein